MSKKYIAPYGKPIEKQRMLAMLSLTRYKSSSKKKVPASRYITNK